MTDRPILLWFRRDLRLADNPMLAEAAASGRPVVPVFLFDEAVSALGAAARWRMGLAIAAFAEALGGRGLRLILRRGNAQAALSELVAETGAGSVWWGRGYDPAYIPRDKAIKAALKDEGIDVQSFPGFLLFEPWTVATGSGGFYRVYSPYWRSVKDRDPGRVLLAPKGLRRPDAWPESKRLDDWGMGAAMRRGAAVVAAHAKVGEGAAHARLQRFLADAVEEYRTARDFPALPATSGLSENMTYGEIGPRQVWAEGQSAMAAGAKGAEHFLKELVWREFAWHLLFHTPQMATGNWRPEWDAFPWRDDNPEAERWRRGMTGEPFVDAAMREMYVTGTMHNRARMIAASYLTKHLMTDWRVGLAWFQDCLIDWDPASNAMGWQWVAGSGPDAAPYFRVFNPAGQAEKFDADSTYRDRWIAEGRRRPTVTALSYFDAVPKSWAMSPADRYPDAVVPLDRGRARALEAYAGLPSRSN